MCKNLSNVPFEFIVYDKKLNLFVAAALMAHKT